MKNIQLNPKYQAALSLFLSGENSKATEFLYELKTEKKNENDYLNEDFIFLIKKIIHYNKTYGNITHNTFVLKELSDVVKILYEEDINSLFDNIEYIIINLIQCDHIEANKYIEEIINKKIFPEFFNHIFKYYLGVIYIFFLYYFINNLFISLLIV